MQNNMGYQTKQATPMILVLFLIVAIGPKLSLMNPYIGLVVNVICIFSILVLSSHNITMSNHVAFMMGYLMCQGYDVSGVIYGKRVVSLLISAMIVMGMYYVMNRKKEYKRTLKDVFQEIDIHSTRTQWYIKLTLTICMVTFVGNLLHYPRIMWINLVILSLVTPLEEEHRLRRMSRVPATILGAILFFMVFEWWIPTEYHQIIILLAGFGSMFITSYFIKTIYNSFSALIAAVLLFSAKDAMVLRVISNLIGVAIAIVSSYLFQLFFNTFRNVTFGGTNHGSKLNGEYH
ncbi:MAG: FUSC family protein [Lachnospiraceae bacterium]|nr:FUSC family protein [Lachnospiraceae bacterium]